MFFLCQHFLFLYLVVLVQIEACIIYLVKIISRRDIIGNRLNIKKFFESDKYNLVITGSWLTYNDLSQEGIFFHVIDTIDDLKSVLPMLLETKGYQLSNRIKEKNKIGVAKLSSWKTNIDKWHEIYS